MRTASIFTIILFLSIGTAYGSDGNQTDHFGAEITLSSPISVDNAIEQLAQLANQEILITGKATDICQKKGCWVTLQGTKSDIRVTFINYEFFVPKTVVGKKILAQGKLFAEQMEISEARHFAQDAGKSAEEVNRINRPVIEYRFVATAVKVLP
ncbi:hypothetical protein MNBD_GAMMA26-2254 [hydrothermal vent metagenome]|uniref:DUF4920 domain-containing protein n=1 Tax=hydrothermal vent metagenome TaxID=652676 RepID=A0A3B1BRT5_9ZZZZ